MRMKFTLMAALLAAALPAVHAQEAGSTRAFDIDSEASYIRVLAWPDGPLKRFGHHHVISHHAISGTVQVADDPLNSSFEFALDVAAFEVDNADERAEEGEEFEGEVPEKDIEGTRRNMLSEDLLNGEAFPTVRVRSRCPPRAGRRAAGSRRGRHDRWPRPSRPRSCCRRMPLLPVANSRSLTGHSACPSSRPWEARSVFAICWY